MKQVTFCMLLFALTNLYSCKKETDGVKVKKPLIEDGPADGYYDVQVNLDEYGPMKMRGWFWGRNSDELFVSTVSKGMIRIDLKTKKAESISDPGDQGIFIGKTHEITGILFFGRIWGIDGIYIYHFDNNKIEGLLPKSNGGRLHMAGNAIFHSTGSLESIGPPCGAFSIGCSNAVSNYSLYHIDKITKKYTKLPSNLMVVCFSKDGSKTLLKKDNDLLYYIFDNQSKTITDSLGSLHGDVNSFGGSTFYYDKTIIKSYRQDSQTKDFFIINAVTNEVLHTIPSTSYLGGGRWSADGSKLFYSSYTVNGKSSISR